MNTYGTKWYPFNKAFTNSRSESILPDYEWKVYQPEEILPDSFVHIFMLINLDPINPLRFAGLSFDTRLDWVEHRDTMTFDYPIYDVLIPPLDSVPFEITTEDEYYGGYVYFKYSIYDPETMLPVCNAWGAHEVSEIYTCGDANSDEMVNVSDAVSTINYVFVGGDPPDPMEAADCNCDGTCNVSDAVWIINYVFMGGNKPCDTDNDGFPDC
jgi:hypothetical protein